MLIRFCFCYSYDGIRGYWVDTIVKKALDGEQELGAVAGSKQGKLRTSEGRGNYLDVIGTGPCGEH